MQKLSLTDIEEKNLLLYKYIRGSHAYGLAVETSDVDTGAVYCAPMEHVIGTKLNYQDQVADEKNDNTAYEIEKYIKLLGQSNPNVLESLFVADECVQYIHPAMKILRDKRELFLTKKCFKSFYSYAANQISKARGLKKKITMVKPEHKDILDFCYTNYKQGATKIKYWLSYRGLSYEYVGCVNIPNMVCTVGLYYDWAEHIAHHPYFSDYEHLHDLYEEYQKNGDNLEERMREQGQRIKNLKNDPNEQDGQLIYALLSQLQLLEKIQCIKFICETYKLKSFQELQKWIAIQRNVERHYRGMVKLDDNKNIIGQELRMSSVLENELPICFITCNINGYSEHCKDYKEYIEWEKMRNPARYESNLNKSYDAKNMMHCFRLIKMCIEIAQGKGFNCDRSNIDREILLNIRNHKYEYEELMSMLDNLKTEMEIAMSNSTLPDDIDTQMLDNLCAEIRQIKWAEK